ATMNDVVRAQPDPGVQTDARRVGFNQTQAHLLGILANPNVSKGIKDVAKIKYQEIGKLVEPTAEMKNFEHYLGLCPNQQEVYRDYRQAGSAQTNIDNRTMGSVPQGYRVIYDDAGNPVQMEPIPGGPADTSAPDAAAAQGRETSTSTITNAANLARQALKAP